jgi:hypothetical protein
MPLDCGTDPHLEEVVVLMGNNTSAKVTFPFIVMASMKFGSLIIFNVSLTAASLSPWRYVAQTEKSLSKWMISEDLLESQQHLRNAQT